MAGENAKQESVVSNMMNLGEAYVFLERNMRATGDDDIEPTDETFRPLAWDDVLAESNKRIIRSALNADVDVMLAGESM